MSQSRKLEPDPKVITLYQYDKREARNIPQSWIKPRCGAKSRECVGASGRDHQGTGFPFDHKYMLLNGNFRIGLLEMSHLRYRALRLFGGVMHGGVADEYRGAFTD